jgi:bacteriorhodopsin
MQYNSAVDFSFYFTFVFLTTTATITFIEAIRTKDNMVRHILNLETVISVIAAFFYNLFIITLKEKETQNKPINWDEFTLLRYIDWSITTPFMLLSLCLFLSYNIKKKLGFFVILPILILNYIMLYMGYLGEKKIIGRNIACLLGFIPLFIMIGIIYKNFIENSYHFINAVMFYIFVVVWIGYGVAYLFNKENKNIANNILDLISKAFVGIGMWIYYIKVIRLK